MKFICHVTSCNHIVRGICKFAFRHVTPYHKPFIKFDSHGFRENEFIAFVICYIALCDHVINSLCNFVDNKHPLEPTTLSSLVAEVKIQRFLSVT